MDRTKPAPVSLMSAGGFACIYKVRDVNTGQLYALKHLRLQADAEALVEVQKEAKTMAKLRGHANVLRLHAVAFAGPKGAETDGFMLLDYCYTTLIDQMQTCHFNLDDATVLEVFYCVCQGVAHMHRQKPPMAHRCAQRSLQPQTMPQTPPKNSFRIQPPCHALILCRRRRQQHTCPPCCLPSPVMHRCSVANAR
jgi:serine/threonine protein kinase